jgi:hypothetical protein
VKFDGTSIETLSEEEENTKTQRNLEQQQNPGELLRFAAKTAKNSKTTVRDTRF